MTHPLVATERQTCAACPTQWEGTLVDGRHFYFRYRFGIAMLGLGDSADDAIQDTSRDHALWVRHGDPLDGALDEDGYRLLFEMLLESRSR